MTYGTLALLRFVQSFGRIASFQWAKQASGSTLKGHLYAAKLNTAFVRKSLPLLPTDPPVSVIIASPFATNTTAYNLAQMAAAKSDYAVDKDKIKNTLQFWTLVDNRVVAALDINDEALKALDNLTTDPDGNQYADGMFLHVNTADHDEEDDTANKVESDSTTSGPSLLRTEKEMAEAVFTSATVTIGSRDDSELNIHQQVADALSGSDEQHRTERKTFVVRPEQEFASDRDPDYLETRYPDLWPFARGAFEEKRKKPMSKQAIIKRVLHLSTRQFQKVDFVLPMCDFVNMSVMKQQAFVRAKLPSYRVHPDGTHVSRAEAFGQVSVEDLKKAGQYKKACAEAARAGIIF